MARKKYLHGIPRDFYSDFVYFDKLADTSENSPEVAELKLDLYSEALSEIVTDIDGISTLDREEGVVISALNFLKTMADGERKNEVLVLKKFKDKLKEWKDEEELEEIIAQLEKIDLDNLGNIDIEDLYSDLTKGMNTVRRGYEDFQLRVKQFINDQGKEKRELFNTDTRFMTYGATETFIRDLSGITTEGAFKDSFFQKVREVVIDQILENKVFSETIENALSNTLGDPAENFVALAAAIFQDILNSKIGMTVLREGLSDITEIEQDRIKELVNEYLEADEEHQTYLQQVMNAGDEELQDLLEEEKTLFGIKSVSKSSEAGKRRQNQIKYRKRKKTYEKTANAKLSRFDDFLADSVKYITIKPVNNRNQLHGSMYEILESIILGGLKPNSNNKRREDIIVTLGQLGFDFETREILKQYQNLTNSVVDEVVSRDRKGRKDMLTRYYSQKSKQSREILNETQKHLKELKDIPENIFIFHESLKLYQTVQVGESNSFHGAERAILNYIDEVYSLSGIADLALPDKQALYFLALNLSDLAVGHTIKDKLARFLSIFAGLLMFDDVKNIALRAAQSDLIEKGPLENIHMYNLNGIFVPSSMVLSILYQRLSQGWDILNSNRGATAEISTSKADSRFQNFLTAYPPNSKIDFGEHNLGINGYARFWPEMAEAARTGTTIRIKFLAGFIHIVQNLLED